MLKVYGLKIGKALNYERMNKLMLYVSEERRVRVLKFLRIEDKQRCLLGDILTRYAICRCLEVKNEQLIFQYSEYGKPFLAEPGGIDFNVSHSGDWVVCAISDNPVGIDVETIKPIDFSIARRFFSKNEYYSLMSTDEHMRLRYFYMLWTLKESYIKAIGKGLSIPLDSFSINISSEINAAIDDKPVNYSFWLPNVDENHIMAICSAQNCISGNMDITKVNVNNILL